MAKQHTYRVLLTRTGMTEWDDAGRLQGSVDLPLSGGSRSQLAEHVRVLDGVDLGVVLSGPDEASRETAEQIAEKTGATARVVEDLRDINLGLWQGMLSSEFERRYPRVCRQWQEDPAGVTAPEGEGFEEVRERVTTALMRELDRAKRSGAVGVVLRPFVWGMVHCWLRSASTCELWTGAKDAAWFEWFDVPRVSGRSQAPAAWAK